MTSLGLVLATIGALLQSATLTAGGVCWSSVNSSGRCKEILSQGVSRDQCCGASNALATAAYSDEDYDNGALFFWQVLGGGVACDSCRVSCQGVTCAPGRACVLRRGMPKCVCRPAQCKNGNSRRKREYDGPVCGTDGRTYSNVCKLKRRSCRKGDSSTELLTVAYGGQCRSSCLGVRCRHGRSCLLDQNLSAHCVKCSRRCALTAKQSAQLRPVCGVDGQTYKSACHLRAAACRAGRAIAIAYRGSCRRERADCRSIECRAGQMCLSEPETGRPRCVTCLYRCPRNRELVQQRNRHRNRDYQDSRPLALCASNNVTYPSWCHIMKDACMTGMVIETRHAGPCAATAAAVVAVAGGGAGKDEVVTTTTSADLKPTTASNSSSSLTIIDTKESNSSSSITNKLKLKKDLRTIIGKSQPSKQQARKPATANKKNKKQQSTTVL